MGSGVCNVCFSLASYLNLSMSIPVDLRLAALRRTLLYIVVRQEVQSEAPEEGANTSGPNPAVAIAEDEHEAKTRNETNYDIKI